MIHYFNSLSITEKLYESMQPSGNDLRFAAIESNLAEYTKNYAAWHWHEYVEFAYIVEGAVECCTPGHHLTLYEGEGYFVNANILHMNRMAMGNPVSRFRILQFDASLLACSGMLARRFIVPIEKSDLECAAFSPRNREHCPILTDIIELFQTASEEPFGYELQILQFLFRLWRHFYYLVEPELKEAPLVWDSESSRIKSMLAYIHTNYSENISIADISSAANISERAAYRTFKQTLGMTPGSYLQQYRISCASRLLMETDRSVTEIGLACGFSSPNYFCMAFKEMTGISPRDFRKKRQQ